MTNICKKILICAAVILIWIDAGNIFNISFKTEHFIFLAMFLLSCLLPYIIRKNTVIPTSISFFITVLMSLYENDYILWAATPLCLIYAYRFSSDRSKRLRHKFRLRIFGLILLGILCTLIPLIPRLKDYDSSYRISSYDFTFIVLIFLLLFFIEFYEAFYKKFPHMEKQIKKLFASIYISSALCCALTGFFCNLIDFSFYCNAKFIFMPWIIFFCFMLCNDYAYFKTIVDKADGFFDRFSKIDLEKK